MAALKGSQMVFITAGMGGGTGTGAAPVVAEVAKELGVLTVGVVTKPFIFEGKRRMDQAETGIAALRENVDSLVVIPNERLSLISETPITLINAFAAADNVLKQGVQSITDLINVPGPVSYTHLPLHPAAGTRHPPAGDVAKPLHRQAGRRLADGAVAAGHRLGRGVRAGAGQLPPEAPLRAGTPQRLHLLHPLRGVGAGGGADRHHPLHPAGGAGLCHRHEGQGQIRQHAGACLLYTSRCV